MAERIAAHRARRGPFWRTVECPLALAQAIATEAARERPLLVDCLTLWLSNVLLSGKRPDEECRMLCRALQEAAGPVVLVSNEVGMGLVPGDGRSDGDFAMRRAGSIRRSRPWPIGSSLSLPVSHWS